MDKVRFGRALGKGARAAASAAWEAAEAAAAPSPAPRVQPPARVAEASRTAARVRESARAARPGVFAPVRKFSSVLWLQVTGTFFTMIALFLAQGVWKLRASAHAPVSSPEAHKFYGYVAVFLLFAWFAVSSFLRARRRGRA